MKKLFDSSLIIALATAFLYALGFSYYMAFITYFNVPQVEFLPSPQFLISYGFIVLHTVVIELERPLVYIAAVAILAPLALSHIRRLHKFRNWMAILYAWVPTWLFFTLGIAFALWAFNKAQLVGRKQAIDMGSHFTDKSNEVIVMKQGETTVSVTGYLVAYSDAAYVFIVHDQPRSWIVKKDDVISIRRPFYSDESGASAR